MNIFADYITMPQLAKLKGVTAKTAWEWASSGRIKAHKLGKVYFTHKSDVAGIVRSSRGRKI